MKNKSIFIIIIITFLFFINISNVNAATCADIKKEIKHYNSIQTDLDKLDCTNDTDATIVNSCNKLNLQKSEQISKLYRYKETNSNCKNVIKQIDEIMEENKDNCSLVSDGFIERTTDYFMSIFYILGPILVIIFGTLDYTKAIVINDPQALKKATNNFVKRLISVLLLLLAPALVNILISFNQSGKLLKGDSYVCGNNYINLKKTFTIKYLPKSNNSKNNGYSTTGMIAGEYDGYMIRTSKPTLGDTKYYIDSGNVGQCVWYVRGRANEILDTVNINDSYRTKAKETINTPAGESAFMFWTNPLYRSVFGSSTDVNKPMEGAIIVFNKAPGHKHGHVAMVEKVYKDSSGNVTHVDYTEGWSKDNNGNSCPGANFFCVEFRYNTMVPLSSVQVNGMGEPFLGYIYLLN